MTQTHFATARRVVLCGVLLAAVASPALAQTTGTGIDPSAVLQNVISFLTNNVIRSLAILAVIVTGVAWMFGHVDLRRACTVVLGIVVIFGAATIVNTLTGGTAGA